MQIKIAKGFQKGSKFEYQRLRVSNIRKVNKSYMVDLKTEQQENHFKLMEKQMFCQYLTERSKATCADTPGL